MLFDSTRAGQNVSFQLLLADDVPLNLSVLNARLRKIGVNDVGTAVDGPQHFFFVFLR